MNRLAPALLFGLRTAFAGMLALYLAFAFQLDQPSWAGTSAVIVAQPVLGASLRKGSFRLIGTFVGATFPVLLAAAFPQDRWGFLGGLALWAAACGFASSFLRETVAYAPMLAGYTAVIVASAAIADPGGMFLLAVDRGSAIALGVVCTTVVFSATDPGRQRGVLADQMEALVAHILAGLRGVLGEDPAPLDAQRERRRALVRAAGALDPLVEQAAGENVDLRTRQHGLRRGVAGLFAGLAAWRAIEQHMLRLPPETADFSRGLRGHLDALPPVPAGAALRDTAEALWRAPVERPGERLLLDSLAEALRGLCNTQAALVLLRDPRHAGPVVAESWAGVGDPAIAALNAARVFLVSAAAMLFWVATGWPAGPTFVTFAVVVVLLFPLREDAAFAVATQLAVGCALALAVSGVAKFALLPLLSGPGLESFVGLAVVLGGMIALAGAAFVALPPGTTAAGIAFGTMANIMPLFGPTNEVAYDWGGFLNSGIAIVAGAGFGAAGFRLLPPLSPATRTRRMVAGAREDLRRLARGAAGDTFLSWTQRLYSRLIRLPPEASLAEHGRVLAVLSVGQELIRSRAIAAAADPAPEDRLRLAAARQEIAEAVAEHPRYLAGLGL